MQSLLRSAQAGTLESSDIMILIAPLEPDAGRKIELESSVIKQYGKAIEKTITEMLNQFDINDVNIVVNDRGALDCTIRARMETAISRATEAGM